MTLAPVHFLTMNPVKFAIAQDIFSQEGVPLVQLAEDAVEIQSLDPVEVAVFAARHAAKTHGVPVFKSDVGYAFHALAGFPGALVKFANKSLQAEDWLRLIPEQSDRRLTVTEVIALAWPDGRVKTFQQALSGHIASRKEGHSESPINQVCILDPHDQPLALYSDEHLLQHWIKTQTCYTDLARYVRDGGQGE